MRVSFATKWVGVSLLAASLLGGGCVAWAQVMARQGSEADEQTGPQGEYKSPLVLEAPAADLFNRQALKKTHGWVDLSFRKFVCDRASLLRLRLQPETPEPNVSVVRAKADVWVAAGQDRLVTLKIELLRGEKVVGYGTMGPQNADEGKMNPWSATLALTDAALKDGEPLRVRVVMIVRPN